MKIRVLLCLALAFPSSLMSSCLQAQDSPAAATVQKPVLRNVELNAQGELKLIVVDKEGNPVSASVVRIRCGSAEVAGIADEAGRLTVANLQGGTCTIFIADQMYACRVWRNGTAPPKSVTSIALVDDASPQVRGNWFKRSECPPNQCNNCQPVRHISTEAKYGVGILALGGVATYMALSRDNASE